MTLKDWIDAITLIAVVWSAAMTTILFMMRYLDELHSGGAVSEKVAAREFGDDE